MRAAMRLVGILVLAAAVAAAPRVASADAIALALDSGGLTGGGSGSAGLGSAGSASSASMPPGTPPPLPDDPSSLIAWAGEPKPITLPELLQIAIRQAPALASAKLDIAIAEAQIAESWARRDWTVQAQANYSRSGSTVFDGIPISGETGYGLTADVTRVLPTGGTLDLHAATQYANDDITGFSMGSYWQDGLSASLTQPLLRGYGSDLYNAKERQADLSRDAAVLARRYTALQTIQSVISAYWDLVLAERQVAITEESLAVARERLRVTQVEVSSGRNAKSEIPAVQLTIATDEESLLSGQLAVLDASLALRRAVGMPIGAGEFGLRVATDLDVRDAPLDLRELVDRTYRASPQLAQLDKQDESASIDVFVNDKGLLPQLDLALQIGPAGIDSSFGSTWKDVFEVKTYQINSTLTFSRSLHQYDVRNRSVELRDTRQKIRVNAIDIRTQLAQAMAHSVAAIELAKRRVTLDSQAVELAKENVRIETDRFTVGRSTNFDVMLRLEDERQAELRKVQAQIDWHKAETMMDMLTGDLLPMFGITVQ